MITHVAVVDFYCRESFLHKNIFTITNDAVLRLEFCYLFLKRVECNEFIGNLRIKIESTRKSKMVFYGLILRLPPFQFYECNSIDPHERIG